MNTDRKIHSSFLGVLITATAALLCVVIDYLTKEEKTVMDEHDTYCIRCGNLLHSSEAHYSKDDPDHEEAMCYDCYNRLESNKET